MSGPQLVLIGTALTAYDTVADCPRQPWTVATISTLCIAPAYREIVDGIEAGIRAHVLWWATQADRSVTRRRVDAGGPLVGVLASRSVTRPNPIGLTLVDLVDVDGLNLRVRGLDCVTGTPLLDLKPAIELPAYQ
ncbi:SAM-dependent methyltransferase [Nocardia yamanashiensis]|uniref:SAM-dependent methyltransferase n=1 Tax=Nocardia yamanashiensis TaxID=209247 RepID=UPI00083622E5|nr:SAM-dependent methyltransferase [Nocardia yamanashiensis]